MTAFVILCLISYALAHNWINSPSRTGDGQNGRSKASDKLPPPQNEPHVQCNPGQDIQVEWVIGHNRHTYLALIKKEDIPKMRTRAMVQGQVDRYLNDAPASMKGLPPKKYAKYHRKSDGMLEYIQYDGGKSTIRRREPNFWKRNVPRSDPVHVERDALFGGSLRSPRGNRGTATKPDQVFQMEYKDEHQRTDRWALYKSDSVPFIIEAGKYLHSRDEPIRPDFSLVKIPDDLPFGEYAIMYSWSGFIDVIDVQVIPNPITNPYGAKIPPGQIPPPAVFSRIDHCWYPESKLAGTCIGMSGPNLDPKDCIQQCRLQADMKDCNAVVVIPLEAAPGVYAGFKDVTMAPFGEQNCAKPGNGATHVCYPLVSRERSLFRNEFQTSLDPEDPNFYATCYHRSTPKVGFMPQTVSFDPPPWHYQDKCISCADRRKWSDASTTPIWSLSDDCTNCELKGKLQFDAAETLHYLPFDEASGKSAVDVVTGKAFALKGGASFVPGAVGNGIKFGGVNSDYVDMGTMSIAGNRLTIALWVNFAGLDPSDPRVLSKTVGTAPQSHTFMLSAVDVNNQYFSRLRLRTSGTVREVRGSQQIRLNTWQHWAMTYDGSNVRLYMDGQVVGTVAGTGPLDVNNDPVTLGANTDAIGQIGRPMNGMVDDLRFLKKALSAAEIRELMALKQ